MEHTKMILMDPRVLDLIQGTLGQPVPDAQSQSLPEIDQHMQDILDSGDMNMEVKGNLYHQTL